MISSYLQLDKAKHGDTIKALYDDYNRLDRLISEMEVERDAIEFTLKNSYLKDTQNLHFKDYESAVYYFEELVDDIMSPFLTSSIAGRASGSIFINHCSSGNGSKTFLHL